MNKKITCILCPLGCIIESEEKNKILNIIGNACIKGEKYAIQEIKKPLRILTTTIIVENGEQILLPVRSEKGIHRDLIISCIKKLSKIKVKAPIKCREVIYKNILNTGIDIIASRDLNKKRIILNKQENKGD
jgi:CxxC motif-containing protein